jgi:hypothetical protein
LGAGSTLLVVSFDPQAPDNATRLAAFRAHYGIGEQVPLVGGYQGQLSDTGESVRLERPDAAAADADPIPRLLEDEVSYDNLTPWPVEAAGAGKSLARKMGAVPWGNSPDSWIAADPSPGTTNFAFAQPGDSNLDGQFDQQDLVLAQESNKYLSGDPATFAEGDWNGDGVFDQLDVVAVLRAGNYASGPDAADAVFAREEGE